MWLIFFSKYGEQFAILPTAALDEETAQFFFTKVKEHGGMISERRF